MIYIGIGIAIGFTMAIVSVFLAIFLKSNKYFLEAINSEKKLKGYIFSTDEYEFNKKVDKLRGDKKI